MIVHTLDLHFLNTPGLISAYLVESKDGLALIDTGPGSTLPALRSGIQALGFAERDVRQVFVTHIHLDHAGAAGWWAQQGAQVFCHPNAARHLIDPSRLLESAQLVYGERMESLWGDMLPAPEAKVTVLEDGERVQVGDVDVVAWDTPGHARHHHAFVVGDVCFTGDVAGARLERDSDYLSVTSAPPQFDLVAYLASVNRLEAAGFSRLYLAHFGEVTDVPEHWRRYRQRLQQVTDSVRAWVAEGLDDLALQQRYTEAEAKLAQGLGVSAALWSKYELVNSAAMGADGLRLYVAKNP